MQNETFHNLNVLEIGPLMFSEGDVKVTFTRPFLLLDNVTLLKVSFNQYYIYRKGSISYILELKRKTFHEVGMS